jgi:hypothetical protein
MSYCSICGQTHDGTACPMHYDQDMPIYNEAMEVIAELKAQIAAKGAEIDRLKAEITDLHHKSVCAYCGFTQTSKRPEDKLNDIAEHMAICDKHPIPKLIAEIMELKAELAATREVLKEIDEYLSINPLNYVGSGSILHTKARIALKEAE